MEVSPARQAELAALLAEDGATLQATYPEIAAYLRTSAIFPRPSDDEVAAAEDAFDLRLLHYMTGGSSENPYWDIVAPAVAPSSRHRREVNAGSPTPTSRLRYVQGLLQSAYAFAIPSPETLAWMAEVVAGRPIVEIGAGRGYWAHQLTCRGVEVAAFDYRPPSADRGNTWFPPITGQPHLWHPVGGLRELAAAHRRQRGRSGAFPHVLFLCWPPAWGHPMARNALAAYERRGGDTVIYVGETDGDRCASPEFFASLHAGWRLADQDDGHVVWTTLHDVAQCWTRQR